MAATGDNPTFGMPDLSGLSETERLQVIAVMERAQEFEEMEGAKQVRQPMEGQLHKYTNAFKGWQFRWFILDPESGMLEYFEKEGQKKQRPRGFVHLAASVISPSDEDSQTFTVNAANGEIYRLRACDAKERQLWVDKLRATAEYHTAHIANNVTSPVTRSEIQSPSLNLALNDSSVPGRSRMSGSVINDTSVVPVTRSSHRAPAAHPHTLDPFREVKEYIVEAEDYSELLNDKINTLPQTGEVISGLDPDILLIKATSTATLTCLSQCLKMLQQRQEGAMGQFSGLPSSSSVIGADSSRHRVSSRLSMPINASAGVVPSPTGSFCSTVSLPFTIADKQMDGPINHEEEVEDGANYKDTELGEVEEHKSVILHLLSQLKLGMDLTKVVLPTFILERRSLLEMFADCMAHPDMFLKIPDLPDPESRMLAVLEWYLTSFHAVRQGSVAKKPYNPIIGETFHCSWRPSVSVEVNQNGNSLNSTESHNENNQSDKDSYEPDTKEVPLVFTAEQVSHHPPVSAFYFECPEKQMYMNASIYTKSRFMGMSIGVQMVGKICLRLLGYDEEYVFGMPSAYARSILTRPWAEMGDKITICCQKTNFQTSVTFHTKPFYGGKLHRVTAEVKNGATGVVVCKVQGEWNNLLEFTYANGETKVIDVNTLEIIRKRVRPMNLQGDFESRKLWHHVTNALRVGDVNTATEHKHFLEERQREGERHRKDTGTVFPTKYFKKEGDVWLYKAMLSKRTKQETH